MAEALPEYSDSDFSDDEQSPLNKFFNEAAEHLRKITHKLDNNQLLELYGLYKQGTEGKCKTPKPGWLDGRGRKKWEAWMSLGDLSSDDAKQKYISLIEKFDPESKLTANKVGPKETWVAVSSLQYTPEPELDEKEMSFLDAARENCGKRVTELLQKYPKYKEERDDDGLTALHWAADRDATLSLTAALKGGCPINAVDDCGQTALHYAAMCGHIRSTEILLESGALILKDNEDCTPLDLATDEEVKRLLKTWKTL